MVVYVTTCAADNTIPRSQSLRFIQLIFFFFFLIFFEKFLLCCFATMDAVFSPELLPKTLPMNGKLYTQPCLTVPAKSIHFRAG